VNRISDLIERLAIINMKLFKLEDRIREANYDPEITSRCKRQIDELNLERWELKDELDNLILDIIEGKKKMRRKKEVKTYG